MFRVESLFINDVVADFLSSKPMERRVDAFGSHVSITYVQPSGGLWSRIEKVKIR